MGISSKGVYCVDMELSIFWRTKTRRMRRMR